MQIELTPRQYQVVEMLSFGMSNKEIANSLGISIKSVATHLSYVYQKSCFDNRLSLAVEFITQNHRFIHKPEKVKVVKPKLGRLPLQDRYGNWEVIKRINTWKVECRCLSCGITCYRFLHSLRKGGSRQCKGCYLKSRTSFILL